MFASFFNALLALGYRVKQAPIQIKSADFGLIFIGLVIWVGVSMDLDYQRPWCESFPAILICPDCNNEYNLLYKIGQPKVSILSKPYRNSQFANSYAYSTALSDLAKTETVALKIYGFWPRVTSVSLTAAGRFSGNDSAAQQYSELCQR